MIPIERLDRIARKALRLALTLSEDIYVVQILAEQVNIANLSTKWDEVVGKPCRRVVAAVRK